MDSILGGLAFAGLVAAQLLAVIAVHNARLKDEGHQSLHSAKRGCDPRSAPGYAIFVSLDRKNKL
jgi:hypothetical protein